MRMNWCRSKALKWGAGLKKLQVVVGKGASNKITSSLRAFLFSSGEGTATRRINNKTPNGDPWDAMGTKPGIQRNCAVTVNYNDKSRVITKYVDYILIRLFIHIL